LQKVQIQIDAASDQIRSAFNDLKKYEQTEAQRRAREVQRRSRAENMQLDEIGIDGFRRRAADSQSL
jgi:flagellar FliJ protein